MRSEEKEFYVYVAAQLLELKKLLEQHKPNDWAHAVQVDHQHKLYMVWSGDEIVCTVKPITGFAANELENC